MNILEDQIKIRKLNDDALMSEALSNIAGAVGGASLAAILQDSMFAVKNALSEILKYYHFRPIDIPDSITGIYEQIDYIMRPYGIMKREVYLDRDFYKDATGAMLAIKKSNHKPLALIPAFPSGYTYIDPDTGKKEKVRKNILDIIESNAIVFYRPYPQRKLSIKELISFTLKSISFSDFFMYGLSLLFITLIGLTIPEISHKLFSVVTESGSMQLLCGISVYLICISVSQVLAESIKALILSRIETKINVSMQAATMMRILTLPPSFFKNYSSGELSTNANYLNSLSSLFINTILNTSISSVFSLIYIGSILNYAPSLLKPAIIITLTTILFTTVSTFMQMKLSKEIMHLSSKEYGLTYALISGIQKIKLSGAENRAFAKWANEYSKLAKLTYDPPTFLKLNTVITMGITTFGTIIMYYTAIETHVSVADYYAFNASYAMLTTAFNGLASIAISMAEIKPTLDMARPIMETAPEVFENSEQLTNVSGTIELDHVSFRYSDDTPLIIDDLSLKIKKGQYIAIVGTTGCGKSTLMRLLLGFENPEKGNIYYDGKDIKTIDIRSLRSKIGVVMQNGKLFSGDIFANIVVSAPHLSLKEAWEAAEISGLADDIRNLPMGMNTIIGEGSGGFSGGQKQRLMIARAIAPKPNILMLDEATSALDNITQKKISNALDALKCTRIVIAHRLSTIKQCNRIIVLDKGKIIEDGTYDELMKLNGFFAELVERQRIDI